MDIINVDFSVEMRRSWFIERMYKPYMVHYLHKVLCQMRPLFLPKPLVLVPQALPAAQTSTSPQTSSQAVNPRPGVRMAIASDFSSLRAEWDGALQIPINFPDIFEHSFDHRKCVLREDEMISTPSNFAADVHQFVPASPKNGPKGVVARVLDLEEEDDIQRVLDLEEETGAHGGGGGRGSPTPTLGSLVADEQENSVLTPSEDHDVENADGDHSEQADGDHSDVEHELPSEQVEDPDDPTGRLARPEKPRAYTRVPETYQPRYGFLESLDLDHDLLLDFDVGDGSTWATTASPTGGEASSRSSTDVVDGSTTSAGEEQDVSSRTTVVDSTPATTSGGFSPSTTPTGGPTTPTGRPTTPTAGSQHQQGRTVPGLVVDSIPPDQLRRAGIALHFGSQDHTGAGCGWFVGQRIVARSDIFLPNSLLTTALVKRGAKGVVRRVILVKEAPPHHDSVHHEYSSSSTATSCTIPGESCKITSMPYSAGGRTPAVDEDVSPNPTFLPNRVQLDLLFDDGTAFLLPHPSSPMKILLESYLQHDADFDFCIAQVFLADRLLKEKILVLLHALFRPEFLRTAVEHKL